MKDKDLLKILSIAFSFFGLVTCLYIWGQLSGFEKGYFYGVFYTKQPDPNIIGSYFGSDIFEHINNWYFTITFGFSVYMIGKCLKSMMLSSIVCIVSLCIALYPFFDMLVYKTTDHYGIKQWVNNSIYFDCFLLFTVIILMFIQFNLIITRKLESETFKIT